MKQLLGFSILLLIITFSSCTKETLQEDKAYWGYTDGSTFSYRQCSYTSSTNKWDTIVAAYSEHVTGDTTIAGKTYKKGHSATFLRHSNGVYYRYSPISPNGEEIYLKDNLTVNDTWTDSISTFSVSYTNTYTCVEKNISLTIENNTFSNVVKIRKSNDYNTTNFWYAKGIGMIKIETSYSFGSFFVYELTNYDIK